MNPILEALEALATAVRHAGPVEAITEQDVLHARIKMEAPVALPCMIVAPPLGNALADNSQLAA